MEEPEKVPTMKYTLQNHIDIGGVKYGDLKEKERGNNDKENFSCNSYDL